MAREKISVVILTRNEESNIKECLETVKWADEIIVIDDESTDKTVEIARCYTDKVISHPLNDNFSAQRNLGIDNASGDWILQMDADERVTEELKEKILELLAKGSDLSAFRFRRLNNFCGRFMKYGGENLHRPLRLFKKGNARFLISGSRVHEEIKIDGGIGDIDADMEHYNFPDISHYISTQNHYSGIEAKDLFDKVGLIPEKRLRKELVVGPLKLFFKIYIKRKGYKDGLHGLIFAALSAWRRFLIYARYWEMNREFYGKGHK